MVDPSAAISVRVPATSANLGPGYDSFGLALTVHNTFSAQSAEEWAVSITGEGEDDLKRDGANPVAQAMARVFAEAGEPDRAAHIICENEIPQGRGLGSSAAAIVGGILLANRMIDEPLTEQRLFEIATELEGHPDNVAAALFGGFTLAWTDEADGIPHALSISPEGGLAAVLVVSSLPFKTKRARKLIPDTVPHADAAFNAARAGLLVAGLTFGRGDLIGSALSDRLHEPYREEAVPDLDTVRGVLIDAGCDGVVLSGAGPTVIGLVAAPSDENAFKLASVVAARAQDPIASLERRRRPVAVGIDREGAQVSQ